MSLRKKIHRRTPLGVEHNPPFTLSTKVQDRSDGRSNIDFFHIPVEMEDM